MCLHPVQHTCDTAPLVCGWLITAEVDNMVSVEKFVRWADLDRKQVAL